MDDQTRQLYADTRQYEADCAAKYAELCPDDKPTPEWEQFVKELDAWNKAQYDNQLAMLD